MVVTVPPPTAVTVVEFACTLRSPNKTATATAQPSTGSEMIGDVVKVTLSFGEAVTIAGATPELTLNDGGHAIYDPTATAALHNATSLVFDYTVATGESTANLQVATIDLPTRLSITPKTRA